MLIKNYSETLRYIYSNKYKHRSSQKNDFINTIRVTKKRQLENFKTKRLPIKIKTLTILIRQSCTMITITISNSSWKNYKKLVCLH